MLREKGWRILILLGRFNCQNLPAGTYDLWLYIIAHMNSSEYARIEIVHANGIEEKRVDLSEGVNGWVYLGRYSVIKDMLSSVAIINDGNGLIRADAVRYDEVVY